MRRGALGRLGARVAAVVGHANRAWLLGGGLVALTVAVAAVVWASFDDEAERNADSGAGGGAVAELPEPAAPRVVSAEELAELAGEIDHPVYWAGEIDGRALRVEIQAGGNVLVSYPPEDGAEDFPVARTLVIGSYPVPGAAGVLDQIAADQGADVFMASDSGRRVVITDSSAYFADPEDLVQVEVYSPNPRQARRLALSDQVRPVN